MFTTYEPTVTATRSFLRLLNVKANSSSLNDTLQNHPDWPGLLCVSDTLHKWGVPNAAAKMETNAVDALPVPFMAVVRQFNEQLTTEQLAVVTEVTDSKTTLHVGGKTKAFTREEFEKSWTGIYLIAEPTPESAEPKYEENKRKALLAKVLPIVATVLFVAIALVQLYDTVKFGKAPFSHTVGVLVAFSLYLVGIVVSGLLLWHEVDKNNPFLKQVCTGVIKGNCDAILSGKQAQVFKGLSWSEVGFFYFTGGFLGLLVTGSAALPLLAWLSLLALPYTIFSIYYQWQVARQWCVLCLAVQALLALGAVNVLANKLFLPLATVEPAVWVKMLILFALPIPFWYAIKPALLKAQQAKNTKREYLRLKFNAEIFDALLKKQKQVTARADGLGVTVGNPHAANKLIKVCNPYCGPCALAHPKMEALVKANKNVKAQIIFTATNQPNDGAAKPVKHLLAIVEKNNAQTEQALNSWYLAQKKDYESFAAQYPMNGELKQQDEKVAAMDAWCKKMAIAATPTYFLNGYQLPDAYSIEDLTYFLAE
jgi:protein-disulfide isomerase/uncharacterized membrane protein